MAPPDPTFLLRHMLLALQPSPAGWKILGSLSAVGGITVAVPGGWTPSEVSFHPFVGLFLCPRCLSSHLWEGILHPGKGNMGKELLPGGNGVTFLNFGDDLGGFIPL